MKNLGLKKLLIIILISVSFVSAIFTIIFVSCFKNNKDSVKELKLNSDNLTLEVGDVVDLKNMYSLRPINFNANVLCLVANSKFAVIDENNILTAKSEGFTKIYFKVNSGNNLIEKDISLQINKHVEENKDDSIVDDNKNNDKTDENNKDDETLKNNDKDNNNDDSKDVNNNDNIINNNDNINNNDDNKDSKDSDDNINNDKTIDDAKSNLEIVLKSKFVEKIDDYYTLNLSSESVKAKTIVLSCIDDKNVEHEVNFSCEILSDDCELYFQFDKNKVIVMGSKVGEAVIKISIENSSEFVLLKVRVV